MSLVYQLARDTITTFQTNDPFTIAEFYEIKIFNVSLPDHIGGFYTRIFHFPYIVINSEKPWPWQRAIAAHELGHALLHNDSHTFLATSNFATKTKIEREANLFAASLLIGDERPEEGESIYHFACRMYVPIEFITALPWDFFKEAE